MNDDGYDPMLVRENDCLRAFFFVFGFGVKPHRSFRLKVYRCHGIWN